MMLALEATDRGGSVALAREGIVRHLSYEHGERTHSERLMPEIDRLLEARNAGYEDVRSVAVCRGPGSFTAVRLAVTTAKTLASFCGARLFAATTLRVMAEWARGAEVPVWSVLDARRGELYAQSFEPGEEGLEPRDDPRVVSPGTLRALWEADDEGARVLYRGRGGTPLPEVPGGMEVLRGEAVRLLAAPLASLAHEGLQGGADHDPRGLTPCYVRASDARREASS